MHAHLKIGSGSLAPFYLEVERCNNAPLHPSLISSLFPYLQQCLLQACTALSSSIHRASFLLSRFPPPYKYPSARGIAVTIAMPPVSATALCVLCALAQSAIVFATLRALHGTLFHFAFLSTQRSCLVCYKDRFASASAQRNLRFRQLCVGAPHRSPHTWYALTFGFVVLTT